MELTSAQQDSVKQLESILGYTFKNTELAAQALTLNHPSVITGAIYPSYQELEFLGDRVLNLCISAEVMNRHAGHSVHFLNSRLKS